MRGKSSKGRVVGICRSHHRQAPKKNVEEGMLKEGTVPKVKNAVMVNCAGAMDDERPYCCRIGCGVAIKNSRLLKELNPKADISLLYRDIRVFGKDEEEYYYKDAEDVGKRVHTKTADAPPS